MGDSSAGSSGSDVQCEECGAGGAFPLEVRFGDGNARTFDLCEDCLQEYRAADLIDEMALLDEPDGKSAS